MAIELTCECGKEFRVKDELAGSVVARVSTMETTRLNSSQISIEPGIIPVADPGAPAEPFPASQVIQPTSRCPTSLPEATVQAVLARPIPRSPQPPKTDKLASIAIVTFNHQVFTRMCLASLLTNTQGPAYEMIVVDNASSDGTPDYLRAVSAANAHVRIILNDTNRGFPSATNQALTEAKGQALVLLNNDTIVPPGWLEGLIRHLEDPSVGLVGPVTNRIGNEAEIDTEYTTYGQFLEFERRNRTEHQGQRFDIPTPCMFCLAMRRDAFERIGPLDERFEVGMFEDDDYAMRARSLGYRLVCAEDTLVHHLGQGSFGSLMPTGEYGRMFRTNQQRFEEKWGRAWQPHGRRLKPAYENLKRGLLRTLCEATPQGAAVVIVSKGDAELLAAIVSDGRRASHFPQAANGSYAGHHPADSTEAIAHLEALRCTGAHFLVFPSTARWWLEHYAEFRSYLLGCYRIQASNEACLVIDLRKDAPVLASTIGKASAHAALPYDSQER